MGYAKLTTTENVKQYLGINNPADDPLLDELVDAASKYIQSYLNRNFGVQNYIDKLDGTNGDSVMTKNYPVITVSQVKVNDTIIPVANSTLDAGYTFNDTRVSLQGYAFYRGKNNVRIAYTAGIDVPADITHAANELVAHRYREKDRIGLTSKGLSGETTAYSQKDMPDSVKTLLATYRKVIPN